MCTTLLPGLRRIQYPLSSDAVVHFPDVLVFHEGYPEIADLAINDRFYADITSCAVSTEHPSQPIEVHMLGARIET
jgi:hypothetical protein